MMQKNLYLILCMLHFLAFSSYAQETIVKGTITDNDGLGLPGVTVMVKNTQNGVVTGIDGDYEIKVNKGDLLLVSYIGFLTQEIEINNQTTIDVTLQLSVEELDEVVVVGYGTQRKSDITGATGLITNKDVDLQPVQRVENMLQGKVAGVTVIQNSGAPGSQPKVNIRGFNGAPTYVIDGMVDADINSINPNDIASISILKDASATAIYGSRGANGVILVTTKQGTKNQKLKIDVDYFHSIAELHTELDLLDPIQYMLVENEKDEGAGIEPQFSRGELLAAESDPNFGTDWQDYIFRTAHTDNINVSLSKGWEKLKIRGSIGSRTEDGIVENSDYRRYTLGLNLSYDVTNKTSVSLNTRYAREETHNTAGDDGNRDNGASRVVRSASVWSPNLPVIDPNTGDYQENPAGYGPLVLENPAYLVYDVDSNADRDVYNTNFSITHQLMEELSAKASVGLQYRENSGNTFKRQEPGNDVIPTEINSRNGNGLRQQYNFQLDYKKKFNDDHSLNVTAVSEVLYREQETFRFENIYSPDGTPGTTVEDINDPYDYESLGQISYLGRVNYDFKGKLLFTGSFRTDASSRLSEENRWDSFFSSAIAYRLIDEPFVSSLNWLHDLKVRAGYGEVGNVNSIRFVQIQNLVNPDGSGYAYSENDVNNAVKFDDGGGTRANPDLLWETARTYNAGVDLALWGGKIELVADYYVKFTEDAHFNRQYPGFLGRGGARENVGRFKNDGVELTLIHQYRSNSDFNVRTSFNFAFNQSEILEIPRDTMPVGSIENSFEQQSHILIRGGEAGALWGYQYLGTKTQNELIEGEAYRLDENGNRVPVLPIGEAIYMDTNGDGIVNVDDMVILGNGHPDFTWGLNSHIDYKNFSLNFFIQGVHGNEIYNLPKHGLLGGGGGVISATSTDILNSATFGGSEPTLNANYEAQSSLFVEDGSFIRVRNITLGYTLPKKLLEKTGLSNVRVYGGVQNLITITNYTGYDPEARSPGFFTTPGIDRGSFPIPRVYTFGIQLNY